MKKLIALLLAFVMLGSLVACNTEKPVETQPKETQGSTKPVETQPKETEPAPIEPTKITIYPLSAGTMSGEIGGWLGEYLLKEHGLIVEFLAHDADKLAALIASEELPNIMYVPASYGAKLELAESGLIKDLEPYMDKMPHIAENATLMTAVNYGVSMGICIRCS